MINPAELQANQLRIGNWINNGGGFPIQVTAQRIADIENKLCIVSPIPLTEEILLKAGFVKEVYYDASWLQKDFPVIGELCTSDKQHPLGNFLFDMNTDTLKIHYLHQLQNLYFALTGEELNINL